MSWVFRTASDVFDDIHAEWDTLNGAKGDHILLDSKFVSLLLRHFGHPGVLLGRSEDPDYPGMVLVEKGGKGFWKTFQPPQAPLGLVVLGYQDEKGEGLWKMIRDLPGFPLGCGVMQQDPEYSSIPCDSGVSRPSNMEVLDYIQIARISLRGSFEDFWESRSPSVRRKLAKSRRKLNDSGHTLELATFRSAEQLGDCVREHARMETEGWKGKEGNAIGRDDAQGRFYRDVLEAFSFTGEAIGYQLLLDGEAIASELCLQRNGMVIMLKTAYDEKYAPYSPGMLMRQDIFRELYETGNCRIIEFYGRVQDWQRKWTNDFRAMYHVNVFRSNWVARMREMLKRFR